MQREGQRQRGPSPLPESPEEDISPPLLSPFPCCALPRRGPQHLATGAWMALPRQEAKLARSVCLIFSDDVLGCSQG